MARDLFINGPTLVGVKGSVSTALANLIGLGLSDMPIRVSFNGRHMDVNVDAYGGEIPMEIQYKLTDVVIAMTLMHVDMDVLRVCLAESMGGMGAAGDGVLPIPGARLGNNAALFAATNHYISLNISSPVGNLPWRFKHCYLMGNPLEIPLGTERSIITVAWRCIPYTTDPYAAGGTVGGGTLNYPLWDHTLDGVLA